MAELHKTPLRNSRNRRQSLNFYDAMTAFVGPNADHYQKMIKIVKASDTNGFGKTLGWIWGAFFFPLAWLMYRKLWLYAAFIIGIIVLLTLFAPNENIFAYILSVIVATQGKYIYVQHAKNRVQAIASDATSSEEALERITHAGGVSMFWGFIGLLPTLLILALGIIVLLGSRS